MKLTLAKSSYAPHIAAFYQRVHGPTFIHKELLNERTIATMIDDQALAIIVAAENNKLIGCGVGWPSNWNESMELGTISVDDVPDRAQVGKAIFEALKRLGLKQYGVAMFKVSNEAAFKRSRNMGAVCWGFWPKPGSSSLEDAELLMGFFNQTTETRRVFPPSNAITSLPFASRLIRTYDDGQAEELPYPKNFPVGSPRGTGAPVLSGRVWPTYHSQGNYITIESSAGPFPAEIIREFVGKVRKKGVSDIRLALPVNQEAAYKDLCDFGFMPVSYLPGWFLKGPYRYDCIEMIAGLPRTNTVGASFIGRAILKIYEGFRV